MTLRRLRDWLVWQVWRRLWRWWPRRKWKEVTFQITDKEIAKMQPTGKSEGGVCGYGHYHPPVDHDAVRKEHMDHAVRGIRETIDADIVERLMSVGEAMDRGLLVGDVFTQVGKRYRVTSVDESGIDATPLDDE